MDFETYEQLLTDKNVSDDDVFKALLEITNDNAPLIPEIANGMVADLTKKHRPEVSVVFHAHVLQIFSRSDADRVKLARKMGLDDNVSYLEIARVMENSECK